YPSESDVPAYRTVTGEVKAYNPYRGWIPLMIEHQDMADKFNRRVLTQDIGSMEDLVRDGQNHTLDVPFSSEIENFLMSGMEFRMRPSLKVGSSQVVGILQAVRNSVLNWSLELEEKGVLGEGMSFTSEEKRVAQTLSTINISSFQGVLGDVTDSTLHQHLHMSVNKQDFDSLKEYLESIGVNTSDINTLRKIMESEPEPTSSDKLGGKLGNWIGEMVGKAASGVWSISVGAAGGILSQAICKYYGIN
ncbi:MAG: hypothetical protein ACF8OB_15425, partial [Phycisphaeraceae bacterium JB051]